MPWAVGLVRSLSNGRAVGSGGDCGMQEGMWEQLQLSSGQLLPPEMWTHGCQKFTLLKDAGVIKTPLLNSEISLLEILQRKRPLPSGFSSGDPVCSI